MSYDTETSTEGLCRRLRQADALRKKPPTRGEQWSRLVSIFVAENDDLKRENARLRAALEKVSR